MNLTKKDVGKRMLVERKPLVSYESPTEMEILDVSPSKNYVKVNPINGSKHWIKQSNFELVEELEDHRGMLIKIQKKGII